MSATLLATYKTFRLSQEHYPNIHWKNNKANAFRHALWNVLIARNASWFSKDTDKVLRWTKTITDWHEDFSPNVELARAMDLHNNQMGRQYYNELKNESLQHMVEFVKEKSEQASKITAANQILNLNCMVYLGEEF